MRESSPGTISRGAPSKLRLGGGFCASLSRPVSPSAVEGTAWRRHRLAVIAFGLPASSSLVASTYYMSHSGRTMGALSDRVGERGAENRTSGGYNRGGKASTEGIPEEEKADHVSMIGLYLCRRFVRG